MLNKNIFYLTDNIISSYSENPLMSSEDKEYENYIKKSLKEAGVNPLTAEEMEILSKRKQEYNAKRSSLENKISEHQSEIARL